MLHKSKDGPGNFKQESFGLTNSSGRLENFTDRRPRLDDSRGGLENFRWESFELTNSRDRPGTPGLKDF